MLRTKQIEKDMALIQSFKADPRALTPYQKRRARYVMAILEANDKIVSNRKVAVEVLKEQKKKIEVKKAIRKDLKGPWTFVGENVRYKRTQWKIRCRIMASGSYASQVSKALSDVWERLPTDFKPAQAFLSYGFTQFKSQMPANNYDFTSRNYIRKEDLEPYKHLPMEEIMKLGIDYTFDLSNANEDVEANKLKKYDSHVMTKGIRFRAEELGSKVKEPNMDDNGNLVGFRVGSKADLLSVGQAHVHDRMLLKEHYDEDTIPVKGQKAAYVRPTTLTLSFWKLKRDPTEELGDKTKWLFDEVLDANECGPNDCVFNAMIEQFKHTGTPITDTIDQIRTKTGITGGVSLTQLDEIEKTYSWKGKSNNSKTHTLGFCVFDARLNLRRLPPYRIPNKDQKGFCDIVCFNKHAFSFKTKSTQATCRRMQTPSFFQACAQLGEGLDNDVSAKGEHSKLYVAGYELFRETQYMQPDAVGIKEYINLKYNMDVVSAISLQNITAKQKRWVITENHTIKRQPVGSIEAKGFTAKCKVLGIDPLNNKQVAANRTKLTNMSLTFGKCAPFDMTNVLAMDIETCSVANSNGKFLVYAVGWWFNGVYKALFAETETELESNTILWRALQEWCKLAESIPQKKEGQCEDMYVYAHNGSRFDIIPILQAILQHGEETPTDQLESNGKFISCRYKNLVFRDSILITAASLKASANSYGIEQKKGYLPHGYLQNCASTTEILHRLNGTVKWDALKKYMDWFEDEKPQNLQTRIKGRTHQQWIESLSTWKEFDGSKLCNFRKLTEEYLKQDVVVLSCLVEAVGKAMYDNFKADIRSKCTTGSLAEHIWKHTIPKAIPKLETEAQHLKWQKVNRGGFCGALSKFDTVVPEGHVGNKTDVTSLYPSAACPIAFVSKDGPQEPLKDYYRGFPDPSIGGWRNKDFGGVRMAIEHYEELENMHGLIQIRFDQTALGFPYFLKKMQEGTWQTLAPVNKGTEYYTIPQVRHAFDCGVSIWLFDAEYTTHTFEPYKGYMSIFMKMKNDADGVAASSKKEIADSKKAIQLLANAPKDNSAPLQLHILLQLLTACLKAHVRTPQQIELLKNALEKAAFDRTLAKLFLNGLLGRNNMKIERAQTLITKSGNDVVDILGDTMNYKRQEIESYLAGENDFIRIKFHEGDYFDHVQAFNVCPYLSGYMLGYSKMLMQANFQYMVKVGCTPIYTDTDSIAYHGLPEAVSKYESRFVALKKTFGSMEIESSFVRCLALGPKKYITVEANGDYHYNANGIPAKANVKLDVLECFEKVLAGTPQKVEYFSITAAQDLTLTHTTGAQKNLRFICLKGKVLNNGIQFWDSEAEFKEHASSLRTVGFDYETDTKKPLRAPTIPKRKVSETKAIQTDPKQKVYLLSSTDGDHYVGYTNDFPNRLRQHNGEIAGGAAETRGKTWALHAMYSNFQSFPDRTSISTALSFESTLKNRVATNRDTLSCEEVVEVATSVIQTLKRFTSVQREH